MEFHRGKEAYYLQAKEIVEQTKTFKVLAKTPSLFIPPVFDYQKTYYDALIGRIQNSDISIDYLFSLSLTREEILGIGRDNPQAASKALSEWEKYSHHPNINLRYINSPNPFSCCIGDNKSTLLLVYPNKERAALTFANDEISYYQEAFNQLFPSAQSNHSDVIAEISTQLNYFSP